MYIYLWVDRYSTRSTAYVIHTLTLMYIGDRDTFKMVNILTIMLYRPVNIELKPRLIKDHIICTLYR